MVGQTQVVVGAKVEHLPAANSDGGALRRGNDALLLVEAGVADSCEFGCEARGQGVHGGCPFLRFPEHGLGLPLAINVFAVADSGYCHQKQIVINRIQDAVIADAQTPDMLS